MATVVVTWTTSVVKVPVTTDLTQYRVEIGGVGASFVKFSDPLSVQFDAVSPGDYVATVALSNDDGSHLDFTKSQPFNVPQQTTDLNAPDVITVQVS